MELNEVVALVADLLKEFDSTKPVQPGKSFKPGIGPFGETQLIRELCSLLKNKGHSAYTKRTPDLTIDDEWALEFKILRPFRDNGTKAEPGDWSANLLHPYPGNESVIGDAIKLEKIDMKKKAVFVIAYEHEHPKISLDPLLDSFELIAKNVMKIPLGRRTEERRNGLVHPEHQVVRCIAWEILNY